MSCEKGSEPKLAPAPAANGPLRFELKMASDPRLLSVVRSTVLEFAAVWGFEDDQRRGIMIAVDEALSNLIQHAYKNRCDREIELSCQAHDDSLEFTFTDRGEAPDLSKVCGQPLDEIALRGRGTHLIQQIMDEVCYERRPGENRLRLKKYLPGARKQSLTGDSKD